MKLNIFIALAATTIVTLSACKSKTGDANCGAATAKCLANGKKAAYKLYYGGRSGDTSVEYNYTLVSANILQVKKTLKNITPTKVDSTYIPYFLKACGKNVYISNFGYDLDNAIASNNYFVKGDRSVGTNWNYSLNGNYYFCGVAAKNIAINAGTLGAITADKIFMRASPNSSFIADTVYWNDDLGIIAEQGVAQGFALISKNY